MKEKNWSFTITGKGDESSAVQIARDSVNRLRREDHNLSDARFVLRGQQSADSREQPSGNTGKIDLLETYGTRSDASTSAFSEPVSQVQRERSLE